MKQEIPHFIDKNSHNHRNHAIFFGIVLKICISNILLL